MTWRIPLADVDFDEEERQAVDEVIRSKWLTMGAVTQRFETEFSVFTGIEHCIAVTNCTAGLHLAMIALGIGPGDEVIVPSLSFVATSNAVCYVGAKPVFADIVSENDLTISPASIEATITPRTKAIMVMHYGGYSCDMPAILEIAQRHNLFIIEDAAHAIGSSLDGKHMGGWGDIGCFSFFPNKNMTTAEGGMVTTNNPELADKIRLLRSHGMTSLTWDRHRGHAWSYDVVELGYNYRIDEIRAALGVVQLKKVTRNNEKRRALSQSYRDLISAELPDLRIPFSAHRGESSCHIFPVVLPQGVDRQRTMEKLKRSGIQTSIHYPPIHMFSYYRQGALCQTLTTTETIGDHELTLPLFPGMNFADIDFVVQSLKQSIN